MLEYGRQKEIKWIELNAEVQNTVMKWNQEVTWDEIMINSTDTHA